MHIAVAKPDGLTRLEEQPALCAEYSVLQHVVYPIVSARRYRVEVREQLPIAKHAERIAIDPCHFLKRLETASSHRPSIGLALRLVQGLRQISQVPSRP